MAGSANGGNYNLTVSTINGTSNAVQISVVAPTPVITSFTPNPIQIVSTSIPVSFTVGGSGLGSGTPTLSLSPSGGATIVSVNATSNQGTTVTGTLLTQTSGTYTLSLIPSGGNQAATTTITLLAGPPAISGINGAPVPGGIWWLYDGFVPNNGYYDFVQLAVVPGVGGAPPSQNTPAIWADLQNSGLISISCNDPTCATVTVHSNEPVSGECPVANVTVTLGAATSAATPLTIDSPNALALDPNTFNANPLDSPLTLNGQTGYVTSVVYNVVSACGNLMQHPAVNEQFPSLYGRQPPRERARQTQTTGPSSHKAAKASGTKTTGSSAPTSSTRLPPRRPRERWHLNPWCRRTRCCKHR